MANALLAFYQPPSKWNAGSRLLGTLCSVSALALALTESKLEGTGVFATAGVAFLVLGTWFTPCSKKRVLWLLAVLLIAFIVFILVTYRET